MATSSIFKDFVIDTPQAAERLAKILEEGENKPPREIRLEKPLIRLDKKEDICALLKQYHLI